MSQSKRKDIVGNSCCLTLYSVCWCMQFAKQRLLEIFPFFMTFCRTIVFIQYKCGQQWSKKFQRKIKCNQLRKHVGLNAHFYSKYIKSHNINCVPQQSMFKAPSLCNCFNVQFSSVFRHHFVLCSFSVCLCLLSFCVIYLRTEYGRGRRKQHF